MAVAAPRCSLSEIDLGDRSLWEDGPPHEVFARLRAEAPVHWSEMSNLPYEPGFWSITRAADIAAISRDTATFSSQLGGIWLHDEIGLPLELQTQQMISIDPPRHDFIKRQVQMAFTPRRVAHSESNVRAVVTEVLDAIAARGEADLVADVAVKVPALVIGDMLGVPRPDSMKLAAWTNRVMGWEDESYQSPADHTMMPVLQEISEYIRGMLEERRTRPTDDLLTALMEVELEGKKLSETELVMFFVLLMVGGNDSTRATYTGGMRSLMEEPDQRQLLLDEPARIPHAVEEILRCYPAFNYFRRTPTRDVELHGEVMRVGDKVALWYTSGSRDPEVTDDPDRFDITRPKIEHQAFGGGGRHFCLGASLARLELKVLLEETLRRLPDMEIAGTPKRARSLVLNQHVSLPVSFTPEVR